MKRNKNILDERQNQKRLEIESTGMWIAFFGLVAVCLFQKGLQKESDSSAVGGEFFIILLLSAYLIPNYLRYNIWSTNVQPTLKNNLLLCGLAGLLVGLFQGATSYTRYEKLLGSIAAGIFSFGFTAALCAALILPLAYLYKRRAKKLEDMAEDEADSED